jgi:PKD repeat protein
VEIDGTEENIRWTTETQWRRDFTLTNYYNTIVVRTLDDEGNEIEQVSIDVHYTNGQGYGATFETSEPPLDPPLQVQFFGESNAPGITAWDWDFGDDQTGSGQNVSHTYAEWGTYEVTLTVTATGGPYVKVKTVTVGTADLAITSPPGPGYVTDSPFLTLEGTAPTTAPRLEVDGSEGYIDWISATEWRRDMVLIYANNTLVARTLDAQGAELDRVEIQVTYTGGRPDEADFSTGPWPTEAPYDVQFHDASHASNIIAWDWDFGDDEIGSGPDPVHTYATFGPYDVTLTITADGGPYVRTRTIVVGTPPPGDFDEDFDVDQEDFGRFQVCFTGSGYSQNDPACAAALLDEDDDVDLADLAILQGCMSGANVLADPDCH